MHNSIIIFIGLLTFLLPIAPGMSNTNVMAFEEYGYEADQYEHYANNLAYDNYYKSQASDLIKKIKCNNNNIIINGDHTGTINFGNDGHGYATEEGYLDASSFGSVYGTEGYNKKGFECVTNNNENIVQGGAGTIGLRGPPGPAGPQGP